MGLTTFQAGNQWSVWLLINCQSDIHESKRKKKNCILRLYECVCACARYIIQKSLSEMEKCNKNGKRETFIILNQYLMKIMGEGAGGW